MASCRWIATARCWRRPNCGATPARSASATRSWQALGGAERCIEIAGNPILAGYTASKLPWTRKHRPEVYRELATILLPHDYLNFWLTGEKFMEVGDASGTGWLDVRTRQWSPEMLAAIDPDRDLSPCLPPLVELGTTFAILPAIADALGLPHTVRIAVGGGDNMMAAIGTGCVVPGRLSMSLGTSGTLFAYADQPVVDAKGAWAAFCSSSGGWLPLICTMNCTVATETVAAHVRLQDPRRRCRDRRDAAGRRRPDLAAVLQWRTHAESAACPRRDAGHGLCQLHARQLLSRGDGRRDLHA